MKLLTLNAGLLRIELFGKKVLEPARGVDERLSSLPEALVQQQADIVVLQEVYRFSHKQKLEAALKNEYPFVAYSKAKNRFRLLPDSLMILSKLPFKNENHVRFENCRWDEKLLDTKGFMTVDFESSPIGSFRLLNLHTTAGCFTHPEHPKVDRMRDLQIRQAIAFGARNLPTDSTCIYSGDFNCGPAADSRQIPIEDLNFKDFQVDAQNRVSKGNYMLPMSFGLSDAYAELGLIDKPTWCPVSNPLNLGGEHASWNCCGQRIDHFFIDTEKVKSTAAGICFTDSLVKVGNQDRLPISDHFGVWVQLAKSKIDD